jgi:hypothetical protein
MIESEPLRLEGIRHGFFTRHGGVSEGVYDSLNIGLGSKDDRQNVLENRARVAARLGVPAEGLALPYQVFLMLPFLATILAMAVVNEMKAAGVYVFAGGLEEDGPVYSADPTGGTVLITDGPYVETKEFLGGFAVADVADDEAAQMWAGKLAEACGWPQEVRRFGPQPRTE